MASDQPCYFWKLPQALHSMIFELVHSVEHDGNSMTPDPWNWRAREMRQQHGPSYQKRKFTGHRVSELMVSKQYFVNAAQAWLEAQHFSLLSHEPGYINEELLKLGLFRQYATSLRTFFGHEPGFGKCVSLKHLNLIFLTDMIETDELCPLIDHYTERDFAQRQAFVEILAGLPRTRREIIVGLDAILSPWITPAQTVIWQANVERMTAYLCRAVAALSRNVTSSTPSPVSTSTGTQGPPLYPGSRICFENSDMLPIDREHLIGDHRECESIVCTTRESIPSNNGRGSTSANEHHATEIV